MLKSNDSIRFTQVEIERYREIGMDVSTVKSDADYEALITQWAMQLAAERPALLEQVAEKMAESKGVSRPPRLRVVASQTDADNQPE